MIIIIVFIFDIIYSVCVCVCVYVRECLRHKHHYCTFCYRYKKLKL